MRVLESDRLLLRPIEEQDLQELLELRWNAEVMRHLVHEPISPARQFAWFKSLSDRDVPLTILLKEGKARRLIGTVGLYNIDPRHQLATWRLRISGDVQGQGLGYESTSMTLDYGFSTLNLHRVVSTSFAENTAIIRLSEKLGFRNEGLFRRHFYNQGEFRDVISFGLLKEDFYAARARSRTGEAGKAPQKRRATKK